MNTTRKSVLFRLIILLFLIGLPANATSIAQSAVSLPTAEVRSAPQDCIVPPEGLVSWWPGDGYADDIWDGNNGTPQNGATFEHGFVGDAFSFDGVDDFIEIPDSPNLNISDTLTVDAWIYPNTVDKFLRIVGKSDMANVYNNFILVLAPNRLRFGLATTYGGDIEINSEQTISPDVWTHVAATYDGNTMRVYINAVLDPSTGYLDEMSTGTERAWIGRSPDNIYEPFDGLIDEVEIYHRVLSSEEIQAIYNAGVSGKCKLFINLTPPEQFLSGDRGDSLQFVETLSNNTDITDTFGLSLGESLWPATLSEPSVGPLGIGEAAPFTVTVTIPEDAEWFAPVTVVVTATSTLSPTVYSDTALLTTQAEFSPHTYLPILTKPVPGLKGSVTLNGGPISGVPLDLRFFDGANWSTRASTTTDAEGSYFFSNVPALAPGQSYYVRYTNQLDPSRLWTWHTGSNTTYDGARIVTFDTFDIANVDLLNPLPGETKKIPVAFSWSPRPASPTDNYEFNIYDPQDGDPWFASELLGYSGTYSLAKLPDGFAYGTDYGWEVAIYSPDGGYGISYYLYSVTFKK